MKLNDLLFIYLGCSSTWEEFSDPVCLIFCFPKEACLIGAFKETSVDLGRSR